MSNLKISRLLKDRLIYEEMDFAAISLIGCQMANSIEVVIVVIVVVVVQDAQLSQRDRAAGCVTVFAKSRRLELGDNILRTL